MATLSVRTGRDLQPTAPHETTDPPAGCTTPARHRAPTTGDAVTSSTQIESEVPDVLAAGRTSHASATVVPGLEDDFDVELPQRRLTRSTFPAIAEIGRALEEIGVERAERS